MDISGNFCGRCQAQSVLMNGGTLKGLGGLSLVLLLLGAVGYWHGRGSGAEGPRYQTAAIKRGDLISTVSATGTLQAVTRIEVGSQVSGIIEAVYVSHNSVVKKGQLLAQIDASTYRTAITQAEASVSNVESSLANAQADAANASANSRAARAAVVSAQAAVEQSRVGVISAQASISSAQARLEKAESLLKNTRKSYERSQDLYSRELIALADLDTARTDLSAAEADADSARADLAGARASLESANVTVSSKQTEVESARIKKSASDELIVAAQARVRGYRAQVTQAQANLRTAQINLQRTSITSPIDGVVLDVAITAGQTVAAQLQAPNLFTLAQDLTQMQVETSVDEADISKVKVGVNAHFTVDAFPEETFAGEVTEVRQSPTTSNGVVTYLTVVRTRNPAGKLRPGMTATVDIVVSKRSSVIKIPNEALSFHPSDSSAEATGGSSAVGNQVYTLEGTRLVAHSVKVGLSDGSDSEMVSGDLKEGQSVVVALETSAKGGSKSSSSKSRGGPPGPPPF